MKQDIKWDTQKANPLEHTADDPDTLIAWVADQFWPASFQMQREFCGIFVKRDDGKVVTTVHKSSFHNVPRKHEVDSWISGAMNVHTPGKDNARGLVAYWHTHIHWQIKKGDPHRDIKEFDNRFRVSNAWFGKDEAVIDALATRVPTIIGYIITDTQIGKYTPRNTQKPTQWTQRSVSK